MRATQISTQNSLPGLKITSPWRVSSITPLKNYVLDIGFIDGTICKFDLTDLIFSDTAGIFVRLREKKDFEQVQLTYGAPNWFGEIDIAPDVLYGIAHGDYKNNLIKKR